MAPNRVVQCGGDERNALPRDGPRYFGVGATMVMNPLCPFALRSAAAFAASARVENLPTRTR